MRGFHILKVSKSAKILNRYNQVPHLTQDTNGKVTNSQLFTKIKSQEVSPFPAGDHKAQISRRAQRHNKHKTKKNIRFSRSTALERSVKYFTGGLKPVSQRQPYPYNTLINYNIFLHKNISCGTGLDKLNFLSTKLLIFSCPSVLTYVLGAQKNRLIETVLLNIHIICFR